MLTFTPVAAALILFVVPGVTPTTDRQVTGSNPPTRSTGPPDVVVKAATTARRETAGSGTTLFSACRQETNTDTAASPVSIAEDRQRIVYRYQLRTAHKNALSVATKLSAWKSKLHWAMSMFFLQQCGDGDDVGSFVFQVQSLQSPGSDTGLGPCLNQDGVKENEDEGTFCYEIQGETLAGVVYPVGTGHRLRRRRRRKLSSSSPKTSITDPRVAQSFETFLAAFCSEERFFQADGNSMLVVDPVITSCQFQGLVLANTGLLFNSSTTMATTSTTTSTRTSTEKMTWRENDRDSLWKDSSALSNSGNAAAAAAGADSSRGMLSLASSFIVAAMALLAMLLLGIMILRSRCEHAAAAVVKTNPRPDVPLCKQEASTTEEGEDEDDRTYDESYVGSDGNAACCLGGSSIEGCRRVTLPDSEDGTSTSFVMNEMTPTECTQKRQFVIHLDDEPWDVSSSH